LRLFVKRVFVMDDCEEILPSWLRFLRGVVDSDDLPLNVSRETLQDSTLLPTIKKHVTKKALALLDELAERPDDYREFWKSFGVIVKEGLTIGEPEYKERIAKLVRYESSATERKEGDKEATLTTLSEYVGRMPKDQEAIYYLYGESRRALEATPYVEALRARGYEVLFMTDPVDQWAADGLYEFEGKKLVSAMRADLKVTAADTPQEEKEKAESELKPLVDRMKQVLDAHVREVRVSERLVESPVCLSLAPGATPATLERLLKERGKDLPHVKRTFEINPSHPLIKSLARLRESTDQARFDGWVQLLYQQALLLEGGALEDPVGFARRLGALLTEVTAVA
jgi:molecular chaperone HtpG